MNALSVHGLRVTLGTREILTGVDLDLPFGELHVLMGPNGSGKSTLCHALMGRPGYETTGSAVVNGVDVTGLPVHDRARAGLFEGFQYPVEVPGVTLDELVSEMALVGGPEVSARAAAAARTLEVEPYLARMVNVGLSGGEKKRSEMLQLAALAPHVAILDEIDSGLDVDAVRAVAEAVETMRRPDLGVLVITHYTRILRYLTVDRVHVLMQGAIVATGGRELADRLDAGGYDVLRRELGIAPAPEETDSFLEGL
jgi:Fe-S cluster assembly ATP-binding protein